MMDDKDCYELPSIDASYACFINDLRPFHDLRPDERSHLHGGASARFATGCGLKRLFNGAYAIELAQQVYASSLWLQNETSPTSVTKLSRHYVTNFWIHVTRLVWRIWIPRHRIARKARGDAQSHQKSKLIQSPWRICPRPHDIGTNQSW